jgi:hypothetical protein
MNILKELLLSLECFFRYGLEIMFMRVWNFAMASNYNRVPKSGVIAVTNKGVVELVNRQSFQDTFINDL